MKLFDEIPYLESEDIILRKVTDDDAGSLSEMVRSDIVYNYEPTCLFERQYTDMHEMIRDLYGECYEKKLNLILGIFLMNESSLCGLAEFYDYKEHLHSVSIGYRLRKEYWRQGIATKVVNMMVNYLFDQTDVEIITASAMTENKASIRVLEKNGFINTISGKSEDWGYEDPVNADRWFL